MCQLMGQEPVEEDIPLELRDLTFDTQLAYEAYSALSPQIDSMTGTILGRDLSNIYNMFKILDLDRNNFWIYLRLASKINACWAEEANRLAQAKAKMSKGKKQ